MSDLVESLIDELFLPVERAERTAELLQKRESGDITPTEFLELAANMLVRREYLANDAVSVPGVKPFFGLSHLTSEDGEKGPSINNLLRAQFGEDFSSDEITAISQQAQDEGRIFVSKNLVMFHEADVEITDEDSPKSNFDVVPETPAPSEEETEDEEESGSVDVDAAFA